MATSDVLSFSLHQPLWKQPPLQGQAKRAGICGLSIANVQWRKRTLNYRGHRGNQRPDLCSFHNYRTPLRTLPGAGTQTHSLQWKPASAGVAEDRLHPAPKVKSKLWPRTLEGNSLFLAKPWFCRSENGLWCTQRCIPSELLGTSIRKMRSKQLEQWFPPVALWKSGISEWAPQCWSSSEAKFILSRERNPHSCQIKLIKN